MVLRIIYYVVHIYDIAFSYTKHIDDMFAAHTAAVMAAHTAAVFTFRFENDILNSPQLYKQNLVGLESIIVETVSSLNYGYFLLIPFGVISIIFLCTTYDSSSYILATAAMKNFKNEPSRNLRLFFAVMLVVQPALIMLLGGGDSFMWLLVIISVPLIYQLFTLILGKIPCIVKIQVV